MELISVIVPAYNIEKYLERCVESILKQTYENLEIILVDDGSTDKTGAICEQLARQDNRIVVIHKENGGLSDARNAGIDVANGHYLSFVDGDDYIESNMYELLISEMDNPMVSLVSAGHVCVDMQGNKKVANSTKKMYLDKKEAFLNLLCLNQNLYQNSWSKLFRRELFQNIRYKKGIINEDIELLPRVLDICDHVVILDKPLYYYENRPGSITMSDYSVKRYEAIKIPRDIVKLCKKKYPEVLPHACFYELNSLYGMLDNLMNSRNKDDYKKQKYILRWKIIVADLRCRKWKEIRNLYAKELKDYLIRAGLGFELCDKIVEKKKSFANRKNVL